MPGGSRQTILRFDFADEQAGAPLVLTNPERIVTANSVEEVVPALNAVHAAVAGDGLIAAGYVGYEAAPAFDRAMRTRPPSGMPLVWFGLFSGREAQCPETRDSKFAVGEWTASLSDKQHSADVEEILAGIGSGEFYQVNHTMRLRSAFAGDPRAWYRQLRAAQNSRYSAYLAMDGHHVLSVSPELFFRRDGNRVTTRPMKGTMARGRWDREDREHEAALGASEKERAENLMIVDLIRNDLGRIALPGSVHVEELFTVERYPTLLQMTSTVAATVPSGTTLADLFGALFPCGSVTGAPKIAAMAKIAALETDPRQLYCGAIGYMLPGGPTVFNVAIRTITLDSRSGSAEYGVGSGITWDSTARSEYAENLLKASILTAAPSAAFDLLETMRLENGAICRLDRHLERICESARYFEFPACAAKLRADLLAGAAARGGGPWRIRLILSPNGRAVVEALALPPGPEQITARFAETPVSRGDTRLFHKTTDRALYDSFRAERPDADDTLLWNVEGEVTEFTVGNLVAEIAGQRWTPPLDCGLLPGAMRAELLDDGSLAERPLTRRDLRSASKIWRISSLRGWIPVSLLFE